MNKHVSLFIICALFVLQSMGQLNENAPFLNEPIETGISAGTFLTGSSDFSAQSFFIQPYISKKFTRRFSIQTGTIFQTYSLFSKHNSEMAAFSPASSLALFVSGSYDVSNKLTLYGGFLHAEPISFSGNTNFNSGNAFFGGFDYKIGKNSYIGARFLYSKDMSPLLHSPSYNHYGCSSPFYMPGNDMFLGW